MTQIVGLGMRHPGVAAATARPLTCGWCGTEIIYAGRGRRPKWCSPACRHRAWEQRRAADSGLAAVTVVDRVVEVERVVTTPRLPRGKEWPGIIAQLAHEIDAGRVYDRELPALIESLEVLDQAIRRRARWLGRGR